MARNRDIIVLNFPKNDRTVTYDNGSTATKKIDGGDDFIERNAFVLVELLNELKGRLFNPNEEFTIIGPSMGGVISRYALAYMEKQQANGTTVPVGKPATYWQHQTKLWISFDAPHQGANVPISVQAFVKQFRDIGAFSDTYNDNLLSPASRQLLVDHITKPSQGFAQGSPSYRDAFMQTLQANGLPNSLGYPQNLRRVAIANGALNGSPQSYGSACGTALDMKIGIRPQYMHYYYLVGTFTPLFFIPRPDGNLVKINMRYGPAANTSCTVFESKIRTGLRLGGPPFFMPMSFFDAIHTATAGPFGSYDRAPGGYYTAFRQVREEGEAADNGWLNIGNLNGVITSPYNVSFSNVHDLHGFISPASAFGYQYRSMSSYQNTGSLPNPYTNLAVRNLVCNDETPFDAVYAPATFNTEHVTLSDTGMQVFLARELGMVVETPVFSAASSTLCPNQPFTYAVDPCVNPTRSGQSATTYAWTLGTGLQFAPGSSGSGATQQIQAQPGFTGVSTITVQATRPGYQTSPPLVLSVQVGPAFLSLSTPTPEACVTAIVNVNTNLFNAGGATLSVQNGTLQREDGLGNGQVRLGESGATVVTATGQSACDGSTLTSSVTINTYQVTPGPGGPGSPGGTNCPITQEQRPAYAVYPNPAADELTIEESQRGAFQATLYDGQGQPRRQQQAPQGRLRLDTAPLPAGLYHLQLRRAGRTERRQIQVTH